MQILQDGKKRKEISISGEESLLRESWFLNIRNLVQGVLLGRALPYLGWEAELDSVHVKELST